MKIQLTSALMALCCAVPFAAAQDGKEASCTPQIHGTIRVKYEYQPEISSGRFEVRNARFSLSGSVTPAVSYKAEIDLSDEGSIKMLDAYARLAPAAGFGLVVGQMRVPFTIDAHRSPHQQYFANRSFIAKQVGNVRDVGATVEYRSGGRLPVMLEGGLFNGSGLTGQKDFWTKQVNFSAKAQLFFPEGFCLSLSVLKTKPEAVSVCMYDAGIYWHSCGWHVEAEYLLKHYSRNAFGRVSAFDGFVCYDLKLRGKPFGKISFLGRYDYMGDHSDGKAYPDGKADTGERALIVNDYRRQRLTGGLTLSLARPFVSDIRINYEKYLYRHGAVAKPSEQDKIVVELMTRF